MGLVASALLQTWFKSQVPSLNKTNLLARISKGFNAYKCPIFILCYHASFLDVSFLVEFCRAAARTVTTARL